MFTIDLHCYIINKQSSQLLLVHLAIVFLTVFPDDTDSIIVTIKADCIIGNIVGDYHIKIFTFELVFGIAQNSLGFSGKANRKWFLILGCNSCNNICILFQLNSYFMSISYIFLNFFDQSSLLGDSLQPRQ